LLIWFGFRSVDNNLYTLAVARVSDNTIECFETIRFGSYQKKKNKKSCYNNDNYKAVATDSSKRLNISTYEQSEGVITFLRI
jgi:hypothetical protein